MRGPQCDDQSTVRTTLTVCADAHGGDGDGNGVGPGGSAGAAARAAGTSAAAAARASAGAGATGDAQAENRQKHDELKDFASPANRERQKQQAAGERQDAPNAGPAGYHSGFRDAPVTPLVEISTRTLPCTPALSVSVVGLKRQSAFAGSVPQAKVKVPLEPVGERTSV